MKTGSQIKLIHVVSALGYALLGFTSFMGALFATGGSLGKSVAIALASIIVMFAIIKGAIDAKKADTDIVKWRRVEIALVILFWLVAIFPSVYSSHFFKTLGSTKKIHSQAVYDAGAVNGMFYEYETFENTALQNTKVSLNNALEDDRRDSQVQSYLDDADISDAQTASQWIDIQRDKLLGSHGEKGFSYIRFRERTDSTVNDWLNHMTATDLMFIAQNSDMLQQISDTVASVLTRNSQQAKLPVFEYDDIQGRYVATTTGANQSIEISAPKTTVNEIVTNTSGSFVGYLATLIMVLMIFLEYILSLRSKRTLIQNYNEISQDNTSHGTTL